MCSGVVIEHFRERFPRNHFSNMIINGDFIGLITGAELTQTDLFLFNWKTKQKVVIKVNDLFLPRCTISDCHDRDEKAVGQ